MECFIPHSTRLARARGFETLKQGSMTVEEYDTDFNRLSTYATHILPNERENVRRPVLGFRPPLRQLVKLHMETYLSYAAMVDITKLTKMDEKDDNDGQRKKRIQGQYGKPSGHGGPLSSSQPQGKG